MKLAKINNLEYLFYNDRKYIDQAIDNAKIGLGLSPERLQLFYILGESYVLADESKKAIDILKQAVKLNPAFATSFYYLGRAYLVDGQLDLAFENIINQGINREVRQPSSKLILMSLAKEYVDKKNYQRVVETYQALLRLEPQNADVIAALAAVYAQLDDYDKAIATARQAAEINPGLAEETEIFIKLIQSGQIDKLKASIN